MGYFGDGCFRKDYLNKLEGLGTFWALELLDFLVKFVDRISTGVQVDESVDQFFVENHAKSAKFWAKNF
jgi:hypothetical protein